MIVVIGLGEREHRPLQWPRFSLLIRETLQIRIQFVRQKSDPTLEQTNKHTADDIYVCYLRHSRPKGLVFHKNKHEQTE